MNYKDLKLRIYTEGRDKIIITFNVYLFKNKLKSLL